MSTKKEVGIKSCARFMLNIALAFDGVFLLIF
jgi:hypothetical protein